MTGDDKAWTVMVYLADDDSLDAAGVTDLGEMKQIGSTEQINLVAQFDRAAANVGTMRYFLRKGTSLGLDPGDKTPKQVQYSELKEANAKGALAQPKPDLVGFWTNVSIRGCNLGRSGEMLDELRTAAQPGTCVFKVDKTRSGLTLNVGVKIQKTEWERYHAQIHKQGNGFNPSQGTPPWFGDTGY